jgi:hypothetical protein
MTMEPRLRWTVNPRPSSGFNKIVAASASEWTILPLAGARSYIRVLGHSSIQTAQRGRNAFTDTKALEPTMSNAAATGCSKPAAARPIPAAL